MSAPRDWTAEDFAAALAFDERYSGSRWAAGCSAEQAEGSARHYFTQGWRAHLIAQRSQDFQIIRATDVHALALSVTTALREGWTLAGPSFAFGREVCQAVTRSE